MRSNLVVFFDGLKDTFKSFAYKKIKAKARQSWLIVMASKDDKDKALEKLALFETIESRLMGKYLDDDADEKENQSSDRSVYQLNRFCARLPSDSFTRLTPIYRVMKVSGLDKYICSNNSIISICDFSADLGLC